MLSDRFPNIRIEDLDLPDYLLNLYKRGKAEGWAKSWAEGWAKGAARGVCKILDHRGVALTPEQRAAILGCRDRERVEAWVDRAFVVATADELLTDA